tara:strand:+ start:524 stop:1747 length:1224 start_codon:yes stop_codon:yes gene_type:complete
MYLDYFNKFKNQEPYLSIDEKEWTHIKDTFDKEDVKESLAIIAMDYPMPTAEMHEEDCRKDFNKLKGTWYHNILKEGEWFGRSGDGYDWSLDYEGKQLYFARNNIGNKASNYFQQENRWSVDGSVSPGPKRTWGNQKFMTSLMGSAYSLKLPKIDRSALRVMIGLRKYICSQFKPNVAKALYDYYDAKNILDFSMGWGDRLAGFYASQNTELYVGLDPRKENHPIYNQQAEYYNSHLTMFETQKKTEFHCSPAEEFNFDQYKDTFDIIFTSPPYFNVERYGHDDTQSWVRYKDINDWNTQFLQKSLDSMLPTLRSGGKLCVNISDVYSPSAGKKAWSKICDPMNEFLNKYTDMEYKGCIGMEMAKRPNSGGAGTAKDTNQYTEESLQLAKETKDKRFCEPVWIWEKK